MHRRFRIGLILDLGIAGSLSVAILIALHGGFHFSIGAVRISAHVLARPLAACAALIALRVIVTRAARWDEVSAIIGRVGFLTLFGAVFGTWLIFLVTVCGGADSYGYVSASRLLRTFRLSQPESIAAYLPVPEPLRAAAPVGYVAVPDRDLIVPIYPVGLPMVMAVFGAAAGNGAEFYVSPLLAALATMLAYGIARAFSDPLGGSLSALLVAVAPIFVTQAIQPMSDVAATFWILLAVWLLVARDQRPRSYLGAGIAAGMGFLTRPALLSAIAVLLIAALALRGRRAALLIAAGFAPFLAFQAWLHWHLYGSVVASGYGSASHLFTIDRVPGNVSRFVRWVSYSASPLLLPTLVLAAFTCGSFRLWAAGIGIAAGVAAPYLFYFSYDHWHTTRFVLPGIAIAMIICGITIRSVVARWTPRAALPLVVLAIGCFATALSYRFLDRERTFTLARIEAKYPQVAQWIDRSAPPQTVVFAFLHSGSVQFYAGRPTLRWDQLTPTDIRASVAALKARGWESWAVVDGPEEAAAFWPRVDVDDMLTVEPKGHIHGVDIVALHAATGDSGAPRGPIRTK